ncbi:integrase, catalytic region, zinc finger, CCHC-type containing protein [Tanacetum coccineum]
MLTKPQFFYDNTTKQALGFQNPFYLKKAQQLEPMLYVGDIIQKTNPIVIPDSEETLTLAEESQQAFWSHNSVSSSEPDLSDRPTNVEVPKELLKDLLSTFNQQLVDELDEVQNFFYQMEQAVEQHRVESKTFKVKMNQALNENERLLDQVMSKDIVNLIVNSSMDFASVNAHEREKCLKLATELPKDFVEKEIYDKLFQKGLPLLNTLSAHAAYIKHTQEEVAVLRDLVDHIKANYPLDPTLESALGHNLFFVGLFCDSNLEVAFRQHICFICNLEGDDLLIGSQGNNLYTLSLEDMMASSPICLLLKALKTKSWLWHRPHVRRIRIDNGTEFVNQTLREYYDKVGISLETSVARSSQQNGVVERPTKKAFRIYNRRTRRIIETIHVDFDELTTMAFEHSSLETALHEMTLAIISSGFVSNPTPSTPYVPPLRTDWDLLFQPRMMIINPPPKC